MDVVLHRAAISNGIVPVIPAVTVAEGYRTQACSDRIGELLAGTEVEPFSGRGRSPFGRDRGQVATPSDLSVVAVVEVAERRNYAVVAQRQAVLRTAASLLGHELVLYAGDASGPRPAVLPPPLTEAAQATERPAESASTAMSSCAMSSSPLASALSASAVTRSCNSDRVEDSEEISAAEVIPR